MTVAQFTSPEVRRTPHSHGTQERIRIGLLGFGQVGSAVARLAAARSTRTEIQITAALVRDPLRPRAMSRITVTADPEAVFATRPSIVVEALGGLEPARTLVLEAIARGIPVVTANKSLLAHHGSELAEAAALAGVPLRFEASVLAGVPFLGTFARRPYASALTSVTGIVNGTTNFILSQMQDGAGDYGAALADAQRRGCAEPDPAKDVEGIDAVEKLTILIRQFGGPSVEPWTIETTGIAAVTAADLVHARELGGTLKPVVHATGLESEAVAAFAGPAFVPERHLLARVHQVSNGLCLRDVAGSDLCFIGPGAGPDVTAVTVLDDVLESATTPEGEAWPKTARAGRAEPPVTAWFLRVTSTTAVTPGAAMASLLGTHGVWVERTTARSARDDRASVAMLTYPCGKPEIERAAAALAAATGTTTSIFRALELRA